MNILHVIIKHRLRIMLIINPFCATLLLCALYCVVNIHFSCAHSNEHYADAWKAVKQTDRLVEVES